MTRLVVDSSCGIKWTVPEPDSAPANEIRDAYARGSVELWAPDLYVPEVTNAIWKKCHLKGDLTEDEASRASHLVLLSLPQLVPSKGLANQAFHLALAHRRPAYDLFYLALSLTLGCPLVSADDALLRSLRPAYAHLVSLEEASAIL